MNTVLWVISLIVIGMVLAAVEVLVIPGFGVAGVLGVAALVGAIVLAFTQLGTVAGVMALGGGLAAAVVMFWLLPKTRAARKMVLEQQNTAKVTDGSLDALAGKHGTAVTPLRPAGTVEIAGRPVDVVTDGDFVERGCQVQVARVEGTRVIVEPRQESES